MHLKVRMMNALANKVHHNWCYVYLQNLLVRIFKRISYMIKKVPVNEYGKRIGEGHPRSRLTDEQIDRIRDLHEDHNLTYLQLGEMYSVPRTTIASICQYARRAQTPFGWKRLQVDMV
jgi:hypothetical protein